MKKAYYKWLVLMFFNITVVLAQEKNVSGNIVDENNVPLLGVNILIANTTTGTQTDFDGNYAINCNVGDVIVYTYVGYKKEEVTVGDSNTINVVLKEEASVLNEVVVTVFGIKKEKKALGYAVSTVSAEEIEQKPQADIARALSGKIAGVQVTGSGGATGSGTNVIVRSSISINGSNQPLYIVDGVPFDGGTSTGGANFTQSVSGSSRFLDLDPNNIESISVLKGLTAANLYGNQGRNGVIIITTKNGSTAATSKKFEIDLTQTTYATTVSNLPEYQNTYGQGSDNNYNGGFVGNWGAPFSSIDFVPHPYATGRIDYTDIFPELQIDVPYQAAENNVRDFFRTGLGNSTALSVRRGFESSAFNLNLGYTKESGFIPENSLNRLNIGIGGRAKLSNNFTFDGTANFTRSNITTPPISAGNGGGFSIFERLLYIPRNVDLGAYPFQNPFDGSSVYYREDLENPYWLLNNAGDEQEVRRVNAKLGFNYEFNDNINLGYKFGIDSYTDNLRSFINKGGVTNLQAQNGYLRDTNTTNEIMDHTLSLNLNDYKLTEKIGFSALLGFNGRRDFSLRNGISSSNQIIFGILDHNNFEIQTSTDPLVGNLKRESEVNTLGAYGQLSFDYNNYLFLTLSGRNDWTSTVLSENQSLFYPSASLSFIPTSAIEGFKTESIQYLKLRANYGTSAGFPGPYLVNQTLVSNPNEFTDINGDPTITNSISTFSANPDLKPELHKEFEFGIEGRLFKGLIDLDASVYKRISEDQILFQNLGPATGFSRTIINAGRIDTEGVEVGLGINPIRKGDFRWSINNNFSAYETIVKELPQDRVVIAGFTNLGNFAIEGEPLGVLVGDYMVRDDQGNIVINPNDGKIFNSSDLGLDDRIIGDPNPDWRLTTINSVSYKNLTLSAQIEYQHGGDVYSTTSQLLQLRGVTRDTEDREGTYIIPGVLGDPATGEPLLDANGQKIRNNIQLGANDLYFINTLDPAGNNVYDATNLRLRDVSVSYAMPEKLLENTPFGGVSFSLSGQNLWYKAFNFPKYVNFDPETLSTGVGNGSGIDFLTSPTSKRFSLSIKASF